MYSKKVICPFSVSKKSAQYTFKVTNQDLTPLQRLQKFKKLQERQVKAQRRKTSKRGKRVTFADEMTSEEEVAVNGSHEPEADRDEKILKPRKSILTNDQDKSELKNGGSENGSLPENGDNDNVENGYDAEIQNGEVNKHNKRSQRHKGFQEKRESTPIRQSLNRGAKIAKESTPKPETPTKRELRQTTPRKTTPKPESSNKRDAKLRETAKIDTPENNDERNIEESDRDKEQMKGETESPSTNDHALNDKEIDSKHTESVIIVDETIDDDNNVVSITESVNEAVVKEISQESGIFSAFRRISRRSSLEIKDACEASSSSIICLDSPSLNDEKIIPSQDIKGRKPINSFSRFPGRNVSINSVDNSLKRKAEESFEEEDRKRFAGETASGSEKSPGWNFFSPSLRIWSPQATKARLPTSTPFHKREEQDSMAVNYDSKTKLDLDDSMESDTLSSKQKVNNKWCTVM